MPALGRSVVGRMRSDAVWQAAFTRNRPEAKSIARRIFLLHVLSAETLTQRMMMPACSLPVSTEDQSRKGTIDAEDALGLGRCLYFYAGRAYHKVGGAALAFGPDAEQGQDGSATPFDTGGLYHGHIRSDSLSRDPLALRAFVDRSTYRLGRWRAAFARFLAAYFDPLSTYWTMDAPWQSDPEGIFTHPNNEWRAWTFEVRFHREHPISACAAWCIGVGQMSLLRRLETWSQPPPGSVPTPIEQFLRNPNRLTATGTEEYYDVIEAWVRHQL